MGAELGEKGRIPQAGKQHVKTMDKDVRRALDD